MLVLTNKEYQRISVGSGESISGICFRLEANGNRVSLL